MMLDGGLWQGKRVFETTTINNATRRGKLLLTTLPKHLCVILLVYAWRKLWTILVANIFDAFGHLGFINILCWVDLRMRDFGGVF